MARNKQAIPDGPPDEKWLGTYGDLVTLLLVFFVVLYAMANTDLKNFQKIAWSLRVAFNGVGEEPAAGVVGDANSATTSTEAASAPLFTDSLPSKRRDFVRVSTELTSFARELNVDGEISINMNLEGIIISLSERLAFEPGSSELREEAKQVLDEIVGVLQTIDNPVRVEGHTDDIPTNNPLYPTNWELSSMRAVSVARYLAEEGGIAPERLSASGNAEFKPLVPNDSRNNRMINRRADVVIIYPTDSRRFSVTWPPSEN
ncbi:MAG: flagellar motor protein MotB [Anaerolineae bacterium]|nr:flagellar motor protein MotB [Anaerolineae bacterium]